MLGWLANFLGLTDASGHAYLFWSGIGADLTEFAILGSLIQVYRHHNCAVRGCPRIGHHPVKGTPHKTCYRHTTTAIHSQLHDDHAESYPDQHSLLGDGDDPSA